MARAAAHDVSQAWDSGYYHLPFAARLGGVLSAAEYAFGSENQARFDGFPLLGELLQGIAWRISGQPQGANFVAWSSVPLLALAIRATPRETRSAMAPKVPWGVAVLACLGIPLVMMHATSTYVDLPASAALAAAFARVTLLPAQRLLRRKEALCVVVLLAISANMRLQHLPIAAFVVVLFGVRFWLARRSAHREPPPNSVALTVGASMPFVFFTPLKNLVVHGNPVFPVELSLFGHALPFLETRYASSPAWLLHAPQPVRWLLSILEVGLPALGDPRRYSIDQWTPPDHPGYRMGGAFGFGMVTFAALLVYGAWKSPGRRRIFAAFAAFTALTACMPQSHELRYTLYWPLSLAMFAVSLAHARAPKLTTLASLASASLVILFTQGAWISVGGSTFSELLARKVDYTRIEATPDGGTLCVSAPPWNILYAAKFHGRHYSVREADADGVCAVTTSTAVRSASARTASSTLR